MERVQSIVAFKLAGDPRLNPTGEKPSYMSRELEYRVNTFVVQDEDPDGILFTYYPIKANKGEVVELERRPAFLTSGMIILGGRVCAFLDDQEVLKGEFSQDKLVDFDLKASEINEALPKVVEIEVIELEAQPKDYVNNPFQYWS